MVVLRHDAWGWCTLDPVFPSYRRTTTRIAQPNRVRRTITSSLQPDLQILRRHPRPLLRGLEQARRSALDHYVHRDCANGPAGSDQRDLVLLQGNETELNEAGVVGERFDQTVTISPIHGGQDNLVIQEATLARTVSAQR